MNKKLRVAASDTHWLLFVFFPFFASMASLHNFRASWAKNVMWAFIVFYGITFSIGKESKLESGSSDIVRYVEGMKALKSRTLSLDDAINYFKESGEADILQTIIMILVSRVTDSQAILTGVYALIFGYFFTRNIWYVFDRMEGKLKKLSLLLIVALFLVNPYWNINGFRFNTAAHVFWMGLLPYLFEGKKRHLWITYTAVLVHFSFLLPLAIISIFLIVGNRLNAYFIFFIASIFVKEINIVSFNEFVQKNVPEAFVERSKNYLEENRVEEFRQGGEGDADTKVWYARYYFKALYWALSVIIIALFVLCRKKIAEIKSLKSGFCFALFMYGTANLLTSIPSGERFLMVAALASLTIIIFLVQNHISNRYLDNTILAVSPLLLLYIIVSLRTSAYSVSLNTLVGNPVLALLTDYNIAINDIIK